MGKYIWHWLFGRPCTLIHYDGEVKRSRIRQLSDGTLVVKTYGHWIVAHPDGSCEKSYVERWVMGRKKMFLGVTPAQGDTLGT